MGIFPKIKCSRKDLGVAVLAIGGAAALVYGAKSVHEYFKNVWARKAEESQVPIPDPPKVEAVINCVNSVGKPKEPLVPDMVYERSISVIAGRPNGGKTLLAQQLAIESGYHSYSTFSLAFKQRTGQSVTAWMRESDE